MRVRDLPPASPELALVYRDLLMPTFPPRELVTLDELREGLADGSTVVTVVEADDGHPAGVAVGDWDARSRVLLLSYLAVDHRWRSHGLGGQLMQQVTGAWQQRFRPRFTLAEVEHPGAHPVDERRGDPTARLRFYARHGGQALDLPYFQPALTPLLGRVYGFLLIVLSVQDDGHGRRPGTVDPEPVRQFLTSYFRGTEGREPDDPAATALWRAIDRPDGIALLPLADPGRLPCSREAHSTGDTRLTEQPT